MKTAAKWMVGLYLLFLSLSALGQECLRWDSDAASTAGPYVVALPNSTITWCTTGAAGVPCTPKTPTYTDGTCTTQCPAGQFVLNGSTTCTAKANQQGNFGGWFHCGQYFYTISGPGVNNFGPKVVTIPCGSPQYTYSFKFVQSTPVTTWVIPHNFNDNNLVVQVYDTANHLIFPDTTVLTDLNTATLTFTSPQAGMAVLVHSTNPIFAPGLSSVVVTNPTVNQHIVGNTFLLTVDGGIVSNTSLAAPSLTITGNATISGSTTGGSFMGPLTGNVLGNVTGNINSAGTSQLNNVILSGTIAGGTLSGTTINGGSINNAPIGAVTPNTVKASVFTMAGASGNRSVNTDASGNLVETSTTTPSFVKFTMTTCNPGGSDGVGSGNLGTCGGTITLPVVQPDTNYQVICTPNFGSELAPGVNPWWLTGMIATGIKTTTTIQYGYAVAKGDSNKYPYSVSADCILIR